MARANLGPVRAVLRDIGLKRASRSCEFYPVGIIWAAKRLILLRSVSAGCRAHREISNSRIGVEPYEGVGSSRGQRFTNHDAELGRFHTAIRHVADLRDYDSIADERLINIVKSVCLSACSGPGAVDRECSSRVRSRPWSRVCADIRVEPSRKQGLRGHREHHRIAAVERITCQNFEISGSRTAGNGDGDHVVAPGVDGYRSVVENDEVVRWRTPK